MTNKQPKSIPGQLDSEWFSRLSPLSAHFVFRCKPENYLEARKDFYNNQLTEPAFLYANLHDEHHTRKTQALEALAHDIEVSENTLEPVKKLYLAKIRERELEFDILRLARHQVASHHDKRDEITALIEKVYGTPSQNIFQNLVEFLAYQLRQCPPERARTKHFRNLLVFFENVPFNEVSPIEISEPMIKNAGRLYRTASEVKERVQKELEKNGLHEWRAVISNNKFGGFRVRPGDKIVFVPKTSLIKARKGERQLNEQTMTALIHHEVLTHAVRAENGTHSPLKLLSIGLAGYWHGEEGIASYREQKVVGAIDYANRNMHFALSIAYGLDRGGEKRNFREVFNILVDYYVVFHSLSVVTAKNKAFAACERVFKCSTGRGTAFILTKDRVYREGNIAIHELLKHHPELEDCFDIGKFDPTNIEHVGALSALGLIP